MKITKIVVLAELDNGDMHRIFITKDQELQVIEASVNAKGGLSLDENKLPITIVHNTTDKL